MVLLFVQKSSQIGVVSPGVPMEIVLNKESKRKTPAVVAFRDNVRSFGEDALSIGVRFPSNSFGYLTDLLGKTVDNPIVDMYK
jgi:hypoxia up-regulated 1